MQPASSMVLLSKRVMIFIMIVWWGMPGQSPHCIPQEPPDVRTCRICAHPPCLLLGVVVGEWLGGHAQHFDVAGGFDAELRFKFADHGGERVEVFFQGFDVGFVVAAVDAYNCQAKTDVF